MGRSARAISRRKICIEMTNYYALIINGKKFLLYRFPYVIYGLMIPIQPSTRSIEERRPIAAALLLLPAAAGYRGRARRRQRAQAARTLRSLLCRTSL